MLQSTPGINYVPPTNADCTALGLVAGCANPELFGTNWLAETLTAVGQDIVAAGVPALNVRYASTASGGETSAANNSFARDQRRGAIFDAGINVAVDLPTDDGFAMPFARYRASITTYITRPQPARITTATAIQMGIRTSSTC